MPIIGQTYVIFDEHNQSNSYYQAIQITIPSDKVVMMPRQLTILLTQKIVHKVQRFSKKYSCHGGRN